LRSNEQSPDIAGGVHVGKDDLDVCDGDQGTVFGYASDETGDCMRTASSSPSCAVACSGGCCPTARRRSPSKVHHAATAETKIPIGKGGFFDASGEGRTDSRLDYVYGCRHSLPVSVGGE
jgi:hypothetical protein